MEYFAKLPNACPTLLKIKRCGPVAVRIGVGVVYEYLAERLLGLVRWLNTIRVLGLSIKEKPRLGMSPISLPVRKNYV